MDASAPDTPEAIAELMARAYRHQTPWRASDVAGMAASALTRIHREPGGVLIARVVADEAEILALAVDPAHQRQGVAARLLDAFHRGAAAEGVTRTVLDVAEDNAPARALYGAAGYHETARRPAYYPRAGAPAAAALLMARPVTEGHDAGAPPDGGGAGKTG